ncbi:MAG TPA: hypothetical protein VG755_26050 [Nannocystaceae bacterium]|nr:hypothetical protein [Nannocystaceae bacterium]
MLRPILYMSLACALACDAAESKPAVTTASTAPAKAPAKAEAKVEAKEAKAEDAKVEAPKPEAAKAEAPKADAKPLATFPDVPADAVAIEVLGGRMRAPKGAKLGKNINGWQDVTAKGGFAMVVRESYDDLAKAKQELGEVELVVDEPTTLVYGKGGKFGFVQFVEAKGPPELEGEADRMFECRVGDAMAWAMKSDPQLVTREQVDQLVATCRTLVVGP